VHPAIGYVVRYKGRSLVLSGDTKKSALVQREAQGVDLLVHEALSTPLMQVLQTAAGQAQRKNLQQIFLDVQNYHSSPEDAATIARDAKVGFLLLNHIAPPLPLPGMERAFLGQAHDIYNGTIKVGQDGDFVSLPVGSKDIAFKRGF
jgi:ribonuclease Z